jgi:hypothetical protein
MLKAAMTAVLFVMEVVHGTEVRKAPFLKFWSWMPFAIALWTASKMLRRL